VFYWLFTSSLLLTSDLPPDPEVAGSIRAPLGNFNDEPVFLADFDGMGYEKGAFGSSSIVQLNHIEVAIINSLYIGRSILIVVSLLIGVLKEVGADPLPGVRIIL